MVCFGGGLSPQWLVLVSATAKWNLGGCIELGFHGILKDIFMIKKSCGIESRLL
jgi:hypothetical protein